MEKEMGENTRELFELADSGEVAGPEEGSAQSEPDAPASARGTPVRGRLIIQSLDMFNEAVELVVQPNSDTHRLLRFLGQLGDTLVDADTYGSILRTAYGYDGSVAITVLMEPGKFGNLAIRLAIMPGVDKVEEKSPDEDDATAVNKYRGVLTTKIQPIKRFDISLQGLSPTGEDTAVPDQARQ